MSNKILDDMRDVCGGDTIRFARSEATADG